MNQQFSKAQVWQIIASSNNRPRRFTKVLMEIALPGIYLTVQSQL
jgi:hypothetical protein